MFGLTIIKTRNLRELQNQLMNREASLEHAKDINYDLEQENERLKKVVTDRDRRILEANAALTKCNAVLQQTKIQLEEGSQVLGKALEEKERLIKELDELKAQMADKSEGRDPQPQTAKGNNLKNKKAKKDKSE